MNENRDTPALDEGLLAATLERGMREWHQTVGHYLGKLPDEILPLEYTKKPIK